MPKKPTCCSTTATATTRRSTPSSSPSSWANNGGGTATGYPKPPPFVPRRRARSHLSDLGGQWPGPKLEGATKGDLQPDSGSAKWRSFGAAHERGYAAVAGAPDRVLCVAVPIAWARRCGGVLGSGWARPRRLKERDAGERGQPVYQLVLESGVAGLCRGRLPLPVVPVAATHGGGWVGADGEPGLG